MIKNGDSRKYVCKFIFSVRTTTFQNIYKQDFYNTHRHNPSQHLSVTPSLKQIFERRFNLIQQNFEILRNAGNRETWNTAKDILIKITNRVDRVYAKMLFMLNNNNISNALNDFIKILENRRWTQKNVNPKAFFEIHEYDYYINDINILRVLSMGENSVYYQNFDHSIRCILSNPGNIFEDFLCYYILLYFYHKYESFQINKDCERQICFFDNIKNVFIELFAPESSKKIKALIGNTIEKIFDYYIDSRIIKYDDTPDEYSDGKKKYYFMPRGVVSFRLFFDNAILIQIFRDALLLDSEKFIIKCSRDLTQEELFIEIIKYIDEYFKFEKGYIKLICNSGNIDLYYEYFGMDIISSLLIKALENSFKSYYSSNIPAHLENNFVMLKNEIEAYYECFYQIQ